MLDGGAEECELNPNHATCKRLRTIISVLGMRLFWCCVAAVAAIVVVAVSVPPVLLQKQFP